MNVMWMVSGLVPGTTPETGETNMNMKMTCLTVGVCVVAVTAHCGALKPKDHFASAIENNSTSPNYVLVTIVNEVTKETRLICTPAPFLLGALHKEHHLAYDAAGSGKAKELALAAKDRIFYFSNSDALKNVEPRYDDKILTEMRASLKGFSGEELKTGFRGDGKGLEKLYMKRPANQSSAYRDAIAHVLLERGYLPRQGCVAGYLILDD